MWRVPLLLVVFLTTGGVQAGRGTKIINAVLAKPAMADLTQDDWSQAYLEIWQLIAEALNLTLKVRVLESRLPEASWNSLLTELRNGTAQVALVTLPLLPSTFLNLSFSTPIHQIRLSVLLRGSAGERIRWKSFLEPFAPTLWIALATSVTLLTLLLAFLWCVEQKSNVNNGAKQPCLPDVQLTEAFICVLGATCSQGHPQPPQSASARLVHLTALVSAVIMVAVYSSSVTAFLAVSRDLLPFSSFDQLLSSSRFRPITLAGSPEHHFFQESEHKSLIKHRRDAPPSTLNTLSEALAVTCGQNTSLLGTWSKRVPAFIVSSIWADRALAAAPCNLQHVPLTNLQPLWAAFPLATNLPQADIINRKLNLMLEGGGVERYANQITERFQLARERRLMEGSSRDPRFTVSLRDVAPLLAMLASGAVLAFVIVILEATVRHFTKIRFTHQYY